MVSCCHERSVLLFHFWVITQNMTFKSQKRNVNKHFVPVFSTSGQAFPMNVSNFWCEVHRLLIHLSNIPNWSLWKINNFHQRFWLNSLKALNYLSAKNGKNHVFSNEPDAMKTLVTSLLSKHFIGCQIQAMCISTNHSKVNKDKIE